MCVPQTNHQFEHLFRMMETKAKRIPKKEQKWKLILVPARFPPGMNYADMMRSKNIPPGAIVLRGEGTEVDIETWLEKFETAEEISCPNGCESCGKPATLRRIHRILFPERVLS